MLAMGYPPDSVRIIETIRELRPKEWVNPLTDTVRQSGRR
jgi:hypothetical protein